MKKCVNKNPHIINLLKEFEYVNINTRIFVTKNNCQKLRWDDFPL